jgi:hypothetical protein
VVFIAIYSKIDELPIHRVELLPLKALLTLAATRFGEITFNKALAISGGTVFLGRSTVVGERERSVWRVLNGFVDLFPITGFILGLISLDDANVLSDLWVCIRFAPLISSSAWILMAILITRLLPRKI